MGLTVYRYHDSEVKVLAESDTRKDGTFLIDEDNKLVHIYTNHFSAYAVGYTPSFNINSTLELGSYKGEVELIFKKIGESGVLASMTVQAGKSDEEISFKDIPKGEYELTLKWTDGKENILEIPLEVK